jgi:hypothetical protein
MLKIAADTSSVGATCVTLDRVLAYLLLKEDQNARAFEEMVLKDEQNVNKQHAVRKSFRDAAYAEMMKSWDTQTNFLRKNMTLGEVPGEIADPASILPTCFAREGHFAGGESVEIWEETLGDRISALKTRIQYKHRNVQQYFKTGQRSNHGKFETSYFRARASREYILEGILHYLRESSAVARHLFPGDREVPKCRTIC